MTIAGFFREFYDWTEAWAPLIPITVWLMLPREKKQIAFPTPYYFFIALAFGITVDVAWKYKHSLGAWAQDNNIFYNIHSILRAFIFLTFFYRIQSGWYKKAIMVLAIAYGVLVLGNYIWFESFRTYASKGASLEAFALIVACLLYLFKLIGDDEVLHISKDPYFWITIGLLLYVTTNFAIFLGYSSLMITAADFAVGIWDIHNAFYLIFCIFTAKAYFENRR